MSSKPAFPDISDSGPVDSVEAEIAEHSKAVVDRDNDRVTDSSEVRSVVDRHVA